MGQILNQIVQDSKPIEMVIDKKVKLSFSQFETIRAMNHELTRFGYRVNYKEFISDQTASFVEKAVSELNEYLDSLKKESSLSPYDKSVRTSLLESVMTQTRGSEAYALIDIQVPYLAYKEFEKINKKLAEFGKEVLIEDIISAQIPQAVERVSSELSATINKLNRTKEAIERQKSTQAKDALESSQEERLEAVSDSIEKIESNDGNEQPREIENQVLNGENTHQKEDREIRDEYKPQGDQEESERSHLNP
ncbi:MAG: hypothetical protein IBX55_00230 [Methyloprofundus sp.]|nr:hypothetical protein [Methyloprofundus sp.]